MLATLKTNYDIKIRQTLYKATITKLCNEVYTSTNPCLAGDTIQELSVASPWNLSAWAAYDNAVTDYAVAAVAVGNLKAKKLIAEEDKIRAVLIETYSQGVYDLANTDYGTTTAAGSKLYIATGTLATKTTANTKWETAKTHAASALSEKDAAVARRTALNT